jgi:acetoin utilization protein AcuC
VFVGVIGIEDHQDRPAPIGQIRDLPRHALVDGRPFNERDALEHGVTLDLHSIVLSNVDIDAHHGDGVYYPYEHDPNLCFADIHEDGRYLFPGTGAAHEIGIGEAKGTKLNIPLAPSSGDEVFWPAWERVEAHVAAFRPEFIIFQAGADSLEGDPLTHLRFSEAAHAHAAARLAALAESHCGGRLLGLGGGGYNRQNLARAWTGVVRSFLEHAG